MERLPTAADFNARRVTNPNQSEIVRQRFYDYQLYATAGTTQLTFFSAPVGQGVTTALGGTAGTAKTLWDTNLELPNTLPSGKAFMIESIEVLFFPGSVSTANTYTIASPALFNATASAAVSSQLADVNSFYQSGMLELNILSKNYLRETPMIAFPPKANFNLDAGYASNSATTSEVGAVNMRAAGRPYYLEPTIALQPAVNFEVVIRYPAAVATPSGFNARVGVILDGYFMRASQ
ncbi:MAG: hypothetical protein EB121_04570 [Alphaproteobacteria bacterium]|nr:hypothetical protein [Pseudomonadota bacterium]NDG04606.1 hypothetical protein [Alphaproteobacteria bacterium]